MVIRVKNILEYFDKKKRCPDPDIVFLLPFYYIFIDFAPTKPSTTKISSTNRQSSSSASSSTSSSIDDALIQLSQQQQQQQTVNKLFPNESLSIFNFPSSQIATINIDKQQRAVHDNINFLASMAAASTPVTPESSWQQTTPHSNINVQRKMQTMMLQQQQPILPQSPSRNPSMNMQELIENINEICYRGFDELNALIQEQRWVGFILFFLKALKEKKFFFFRYKII
jgi:hypothetical protein